MSHDNTSHTIINYNPEPGKVYIPVFMDIERGLPTNMPQGAIVNIGGTNLDNFTVAGKSVLLADGSTTTGEPSTFLNLQIGYENTDDGNEHAIIQVNDTNNLGFRHLSTGNSFILDALTGTFNFAGETTFNNVVISTNETHNDPVLQVLTVPGQEFPTLGIINNDDAVYLNKIILNTTINDIDFDQFYSDFYNHANPETEDLVHIAENIGVVDLPAPSNFTPGSSVQKIVEEINDFINNTNNNIISLTTSTSGLESQLNALIIDEAFEPLGVTYIQSDPATEWVIEHNKNTENVVFTIFDENNRQIIADNSVIYDANTLKIYFSIPQEGRMNIVFYSSLGNEIIYSEEES